MKLSEYLQAIEKCPDDEVEIESPNGKPRKIERLTAEFGVYDNWPILLDLSLEETIHFLEETKKYKLAEQKSQVYWDYIPGTVRLQVRNISLYCTTDYGLRQKERGKIESQRQMKNYQTSILLHHYQKERIPNISAIRAISLVIENIGEEIIKKNVRVCMSHTTGWKYLDGSKDYSKTVYFPDEEEIKIFGGKK